MNEHRFNGIHIVDYLNIISPPNRSYEHAAELFDKLAAMARELNVTVICNDKPFTLRGGEAAKFESSLVVKCKPSVITFKKLRKMPFLMTPEQKNLYNAFYGAE